MCEFAPLTSRKFLDPSLMEIVVYYFNLTCYRNSDVNSKLIICTEGNAGFYEAGILSSAIETNHSVLGWNHPGFGYSTVNIYKKII